MQIGDFRGGGGGAVGASSAGSREKAQYRNANDNATRWYRVSLGRDLTAAARRVRSRLETRGRLNRELAGARISKAACP